jgi:hypothetical protein
MDNVRRVFMTLDTEMASPHAAERRIGKQAFLEVLELPKMLRVQFGSIWKFSTLGCLQNWLPFLLFGFLQETMSLTLYGGRVLGYSAGFRVQSANKCPEQTELG